MIANDPSTRRCFANARFHAVLDFQSVEPARQNSTSIHAETPNASEENQRGKGSVTNPKRVPKNDSSIPQALTLQSKAAMGLTNTRYARAPQASGVAAVANKITDTFVKLLC